MPPPSIIPLLFSRLIPSCPATLSIMTSPVPTTLCMLTLFDARLFMTFCFFLLPKLSTSICIRSEADIDPPPTAVVVVIVVVMSFPPIPLPCRPSYSFVRCSRANIDPRSAVGTSLSVPLLLSNTHTYALVSRPSSPRPGTDAS